MQLFEPAETFENNSVVKDPSLQRVGENPPYDSSEEGESDREESKVEAKNNQQQVKEEFEQI